MFYSVMCVVNVDCVECVNMFVLLSVVIMLFSEWSNVLFVLCVPKWFNVFNVPEWFNVCCSPECFNAHFGMVQRVLLLCLLLIVNLICQNGFIVLPSGMCLFCVCLYVVLFVMVQHIFLPRKD